MAFYFDRINDNMLANSLVSEGNTYRLANVMKRAISGEDITVALIGGSITQGCAASDYDKYSYAALVRDWWINTFPSSKISFVNAGVGGTQSILGVHRVDTDVLVHNPDFVIVEFAVNDHPDDWLTEAYANLCHKILSYKTNPAVVLVFTAGEDMINTQDTEIEVGNYYKLPMISQRDTIKPEIEKGNLTWKEIGSDWVHPTDLGHTVIAEIVCHYLQSVLDNLESADTGYILPKPYISEKYKGAKIYTYDDIKPVSLGSFVYRYEEEQFWLRYRKTWCCENGSDPIIFNVEGERILLLYEGGTTDKHKISVSVDGSDYRMIESTMIDAGSAAVYMAYEGEKGKHTISVKCNEGRFNMKALLVS